MVGNWEEGRTCVSSWLLAGASVSRGPLWAVDSWSMWLQWQQQQWAFEEVPAPGAQCSTGRGGFLSGLRGPHTRFWQRGFLFCSSGPSGPLQLLSLEWTSLLDIPALVKVLVSSSVTPFTGISLSSTQAEIAWGWAHLPGASLLFPSSLDRLPPLPSFTRCYMTQRLSNRCFPFYIFLLHFCWERLLGADPVTWLTLLKGFFFPFCSVCCFWLM